MSSAGTAALCNEIKIVDEDGNELPVGEVGEVVSRGPNAMLGYWNKPEETAATIKNGWVHTGDCGHMDKDGFVFISDRLKDMIVSGGENVYSIEVENAISTHPAVAAATVFGIQNRAIAIVWRRQGTKTRPACTLLGRKKPRRKLGLYPPSYRSQFTKDARECC